MRPVLVCLLVIIVAGCASGYPYTTKSLGVNLLGPYTSLNSYPITTAQAGQSGYQQSSNASCNPYIGTAYSYQGKGPSRNYPVVFYFTAGGQLSGISVDLFGADSIAQSLTPFWMPVAAGQYRMSVTLRGDNICDAGYTFAEPVGDQVVINAFSKSPYPMPVLLSDAVAAKFTAGACISEMGTHYFYDMNSAPLMSWNSSSLVPLVLMFNEGSLNAIFFTTIDVQQSLTNSHQWDGVALPNSLMCLNWCDSSCNWPGSSSWSTMHFFFNPASAAPCSSRC